MLLSEIPVFIEEEDIVSRTCGNGLPTTPAFVEQIKKSITRARSVLRPQAVYTTFPVVFKDTSILLGDVLLAVPALSLYLKGADQVSVVAVTVGEAIDKEIDLLFQNNLPTDALLNYIVSTVVVEQAVKWVIKLLTSEQRRKGLHPSPVIGPGYQNMDFSLEHTPTLLQLVATEQINISCNEYFHLMPSKSTVFMLGWGPIPGKQQSKCKLCSKQATCMFNKERRGFC